MSNSLWPHGLQSTRLLCPWDSPGKNTGVCCHSLLGIFLTQGSNLGLLHCRQIHLQSEPLGKPILQCQILHIKPRIDTLFLWAKLLLRLNFDDSGFHHIRQDHGPLEYFGSPRDSSLIHKQAAAYSHRLLSGSAISAGALPAGECCPLKCSWTVKRVSCQDSAVPRAQNPCLSSHGGWSTRLGLGPTTIASLTDLTSPVFPSTQAHNLCRKLPPHQPPFQNVLSAPARMVGSWQSLLVWKYHLELNRIAQVHIHSMSPMCEGIQKHICKPQFIPKSNKVSLGSQLTITYIALYWNKFIILFTQVIHKQKQTKK